MKKAKAPRVPILENAFEVNLPKLMRAAKSTGASRHLLDDGVVRTVVVVTETRLALFLGGRHWVLDIVLVRCLGDRVRSLLKCPRAHEGNFQSLYFRTGELACRHCHKLRYRSNIAGNPTDRARIARSKLLRQMGAEVGEPCPRRKPFKWRQRHLRLLKQLSRTSTLHYDAVRQWLQHEKPASSASVK